MIDVYGTVNGMRIERKKLEYSEKTHPAATFSTIYPT
jgi:hypothetical protein